MKINKLSNKGFTTADVVIAVIIIILFVSIITSSFYNYYISIQGKNRIAYATNAAIDIIENVELMNYKEINNHAINSLVQNLINDGTIPKGITVQTSLQNYNETTGNEDKEDVIKILNVKIEYPLGDKTENYEITRLITK